MRYVLLSLFVCLFSFGPSAFAKSNHEILVKFHSEPQFNFETEFSGIESVAPMPLVSNLYRMAFSDLEHLVSNLKDMKSRSDVAYAHKVRKFKVAISSDTKPIKSLLANPPLKTPVAPNGKRDPRRGDNWNLSLNNVYAAWKYSKGKGVTVAVLDTGVDYNHEDLGYNIWRNPGETGDGKESNEIDDDGNGYIDDHMGWDFVEQDNLPYDDFGHGTHVAGIIAQVENNGIGDVGVSPEAKIMNLRFLGTNGGGTDADAILALDYAVKNGANVINNSWGGREESPSLKEAFKALENSGVVICNAAGNDGADLGAGSAFPAKYKLKNTITVAANGKSNQITYFSNHSVFFVQLSSAGLEVRSTVPEDKYESLSGTSMATPNVSGAVALALGLRPDLTPEKVKLLLKKHDLFQPSQPIHNPTYGQYTRYTEWRRLSSPAHSIKWLAQHPEF